MDTRIGRYHFTVEPFSEDFRGNLSWASLGSHLLRCASLHAGSLGMGYDSMIEQGHVWVLSRLVVELRRMPRTWESYTVSTWISSVRRQFTDRLYALTAPDGTAYGYAHTVWALIDMNTRHAADLEHLADGALCAAALPEHACPIAPPGRIRVKRSDMTRRRRTYYTDIDINRHVNSIRYVEMMLDLFPRSTFEAFAVERIDVAYCAETYWGASLEFRVEQLDAMRFAIEVLHFSAERPEPEVAVRATVQFAPHGSDSPSSVKLPA